MASITRERNGRRTIQFVASDKKRKSIRLGKVSQRVAEAVKIRVEHLNAAKIHGHAIDDETSRWVGNLDDKLADKLSAVDLIPKRERATLAAFVDGYIASRTDVKPNTLIVWRQTRRNLVDFFGEEKPLREVTQGDADNWKLWLSADQRLGENTITKRCQFANQFFRSAKRHRLISENPFAHLKGKSTAAKKHFITPEEAAKVLDACPNVQWRTIFALARYAGMRCPSEILALRWVDVDWANERFTVHSSKTEHHANKATRIVPLFPELRPILADCFDDAEPGTEFVITEYRLRESNLRTQLHRIIRRAGLEPWPNAFNSLRSTRQTELQETYPRHVVCLWLGNSEPIADKHYLQVTEDHFKKAVQNPVQQAHAIGRKTLQPKSTAHKKAPVFPGLTTPCDLVQSVHVEDKGIEPSTS